MKRILLALALMAGVGCAKAQQEVGKWSVTPRVGVNMSKLSGQDMLYDGLSTNAKVSAKYKWALTAGAEAEYQAWPQVGISAGVFYSNEGYSYGKVADVGDYSQSLHFVSIPILLNFYIEPNLLPGLALKAGVQLGYLAKATRHVDGVSVGNNDEFNRVNFSIPAGISYTYHQFTADVRYNIGVANLCNISDTDWTWHTGSLWITLGYQFTL